MSEAARLRYRSVNEFIAPMTIRMPCGGGIYGGQTHSQSPEAMFTQVCGLRTVMPSNPYDAKGLLIAAIENDDPVIFLEPKRLYNGPFDGHHDRPVTPWTGRPGSVVPTGYYTVPLDSAAIVRPGNALTVLTYGTTVHVSLTAAEETGIDAEVIDLRSLWPLDLDTIVNSVKKTGRCVVVHEATRTCGFGAELIALVQEHCFHHLEAPVERVTGWDTPYPHAQEWAYFPARAGLAKRSSARWRVERMGIHVIKMPDIGEGIAEVELVAWHVKVGDMVAEDQPLADVMTDKATVEIPAPVVGRVVALGGEVGQVMAVGGELIRLEVEGEGNLAGRGRAAGQGAGRCRSRACRRAASARRRAQPAAAVAAAPAKAAAPAPSKPARQAPAAVARQPGEKPLASPAVRKRAWDLGIELRYVHGSGPAGRILHEDLDAYLQGQGAPGQARGGVAYAERNDEENVPVIGLRRKIAQKMAESKRRIPHFSYVEEIDVTELEELRASLNQKWGATRGKLTLLPLLARAMVVALRDFPQINARYDDEAGVVTRYGAVHIGIATQSDGGLMVPVMRHAEARDLWSMAAEIIRLAEAVRTGAASRDELSGSTITITSLGPLGGIVTTPVINHPEVGIVGVNRIVERPAIRNGAVVARKLMNLSSSFDHRVVDGMDAARFIQAVRALLEQPALLFVE